MPINREGSYADLPRGGYRPHPTPPPSIIPQSANRGGVEDIDTREQRDARQDARTQKKADLNKDPIMELLQQFYDEFNGELDYNDPVVMSILNNARNTTMQSATGAGIFGPYSQNMAEQAYVKSQAGLVDSRQHLAQQALGMLTNYKTDKRNFDYQKAQDAYASGMDKWKYDQQHNGDLWRGIGGGLGAIGGGILGAAGGPAGIVAGAAGGFNLGQQIGGGAYQMFNPSPGPPAFNPPSYHGSGN